jgi:hypothetical protein
LDGESQRCLKTASRWSSSHIRARLPPEIFCHGALQNRPPVGASKPASVVGLRIPHSLLVSNNYWTHHQSFFMSRRKRALCPWMPAANTIVTVNRQRFPDRR